MSGMEWFCKNRLETNMFVSISKRTIVLSTAAVEALCSPEQVLLGMCDEEKIGIRPSPNVVGFKVSYVQGKQKNASIGCRKFLGIVADKHKNVRLTVAQVRYPFKIDGVTLIVDLTKEVKWTDTNRVSV